MVDSKTAGKTAKKFSGVMLALKIEDAQAVSNFLQSCGSNINGSERIYKVRDRIDKQINNREAQGLGYPRGVKQMQEEGALPPITQEEIDEVADRSVDAAIEQADQEDTAQMQSFDAAREEDAEAEDKERKAEERADTDMETAMDAEKEEEEKYIRENRVK